MNLIELYIQEVIRRLPEKDRDDIAMELNSTIEDMLPENYSEKDVKMVLYQLGNPALLASRYQDRPMHLIGPRYYDVYIRLLKMILPIAIMIPCIVIIVENILTFTGGEMLVNIIITSIREIITGIISTAIQVFFWVTLVFAIIERTEGVKRQTPLTASFKEWTPEDLKDTPYIPRKKAISKGEVFSNFFWLAIWATIYFKAESFAGVYEKGEKGLELVIPTFNQDVWLSYWPFIVVIIGLEIALTIYKWMKAQWTNKVAAFNLIVHISSFILFIVMISNPNLFNPSFITYMTEVVSDSVELKNLLFFGPIFIFLLVAVLDSYQGFRKASIRLTKGSEKTKYHIPPTDLK